MLLPQSATFHCLPLREQAKQQLCTLISSVFHHVVASVAGVGVSLPLHSQRVYVNLHNAWNSLNKIVESTKLRASLWVEWTSFLQVIASAGIHCSMHTLFDKKARPCNFAMQSGWSQVQYRWWPAHCRLQLSVERRLARTSSWNNSKQQQRETCDYMSVIGCNMVEQNAYTYYIILYTYIHNASQNRHWDILRPCSHLLTLQTRKRPLNSILDWEQMKIMHSNEHI